MATVADLLRQLGNHAAPDGGSALVGPITLPANTIARLPLPAPSVLTKAWSGAVGRSPEAHHALGLAAVQAGESIALMGHGRVPHDDLLLIMLSRLLAEPHKSALWLTPDAASLESTVALLETLRPDVRWQNLQRPIERRASAQLTLLTYDDLHRRVLQFADRVWGWLWPSLRLVALPGLQHANGAAGGHVIWLLRRLDRLAAQMQPIAALAPVAAADSVLPWLLNRPVRVLAASTGPETPTLVALWRTGPDRLTTLQQLARALIQRQLALTIMGRDPAETAMLRASLPSDLPVGLPARQARVVVVPGVPEALEIRQELLRAGYRLVILLAGDTPQEQLLAAQPSLLPYGLPAWPLPRANSLIAANELACAASERPITAAEVQTWQAREQIQRLVDRGILQPVGEGGEWQPAPSAPEPYPLLHPRTVRGMPVRVLRPDGSEAAQLATHLAERWAIPGAIWAPGWEVEQRSASEVLIAPATGERATWLSEDVRVTPGEQLTNRIMSLGTRKVPIQRLRVNATARAQTLLELLPGQPMRRINIAGASERRWKAVALSVPVAITPGHPAPGWSLIHSLPFVVLGHAAALLAWFDRTAQRLLLIEAESSGTGLAEVLYGQFEAWLQLAQQLATACAHHSLYAPFATAELAWINELLPPLVVVAPAPPPSAAPPQTVLVPPPPERPSQPAVSPTAPPVGPRLVPAPSTSNPAREAKPQTSSPAPVPAPAAERVPNTPRPAVPSLSAAPTPAKPVEPGKPKVYSAPQTVPPPAIKPAVKPAAPKLPEPERPASPTRIAAVVPPVAPVDPPSSPAAPSATPEPSLPPYLQPRLTPAAPDPGPGALPPAAVQLPAASPPPKATLGSNVPATPAASIEPAAEPEQSQTEAAPAPIAERDPVAPAAHAAQASQPPGQSVEPVPPAEPLLVTPPILSAPDELEEDSWIDEPELTPPAVINSPAAPAEVLVEAEAMLEEAAPQASFVELVAPEVVAPNPAISLAAQVEQVTLLPAPPEPAPEANTAQIAQPPVAKPAARPVSEVIMPPAEDEDEDEASWIIESPPDEPNDVRWNSRATEIEDIRWAPESPPPPPAKERWTPRPGPNRAATNDRGAERSPTGRPAERSSNNRQPERPSERPTNERPIDRSGPSRPAERPANQRPIDRPPARPPESPRQPPSRPAQAGRTPPDREPERNPGGTTNKPHNNPPRPQPRGPQPTPPRSANRPPPSEPPVNEPPRRPAPPAAQQHNQAAPEPAAPNVGSMIERMRALREARSAQTPSNRPTRVVQPSSEPIELRFSSGQRVHCLPYGNGIIRESRLVDGREQLTIEFADDGLIEVDPTISLVRVLPKTPPTTAPDLD